MCQNLAGISPMLAALGQYQPSSGTLSHVYVHHYCTQQENKQLQLYSNQQAVMYLASHMEVCYTKEQYSGDPL